MKTMYTNPEKMDAFKFQYSRKIGGKRFQNTIVDKLPVLNYRFATEKNWKATDKRVTSKLDKLYEWFDGYWKFSSTDEKISNQSHYEQELEIAILNAYESVNERWNKKLESEFEIEFGEDLHKFILSKKVD